MQVFGNPYSNSKGSIVANATVAQAAGLQSNASVASFTIKDTAANVVAGFSGLAKDTKLTSISLTNTTTPTLQLTGSDYAADASVLAKIVSPYKLAVSAATVAQASALQANSHVTSFTLTDTAANVQGSLSSLLSDTKLTSIAFSNTTTATLSLTGSAYAADTSVLGKITSPYNLTVSGATVAQAAGLQANSHVTSFTITDTAANIQARLAALNSDTHLQSVTVSNGQLVYMTSAQFAADTSLVGKLANATIDVTGVTASGASAVAQNSHVKAEGVSDTLANIGSNLDALEALAKAGKLTGIAVTDTGQTLTISQSQYAADLDAIKLLSGNYTINQTGTPPASGLHINFVYDSSMNSAPASYIAALNTAASILEADITDNITLNIAVGWGEVGGTPISSGVAEGGSAGDIYQNYATVRNELIAHMTGPAASETSYLLSGDPYGGAYYDVSGALAKAWGLTSATSSQIDGEVGVASSGWPSSDYVGALLHEITHAMGRNSGWGGTYGDTTPLDLFRYSAAGQHVTDGSLVDPTLHANATGLQYFSLDGGKTVLADFANSSDYGDWASNSLTLNDPNNAYLSGTPNSLTTVDLIELGAMGFHLSSGAQSAITASGIKYA